MNKLRPGLWSRNNQAQSDFGSRTLLESILGDEKDHLEWLESQFDQIGHMGIEGYLGSQLE